jgi:hypothetical protein
MEDPAGRECARFALLARRATPGVGARRMCCGSLAMMTSGAASNTSSTVRYTASSGVGARVQPINSQERSQ